MSILAADASPQALSDAVEANMVAVTPLIFGAAPSGEWEDTPERIVFAMGLPFASLNGVCRTCFESESAADRIQATLDFFRKRRLPMLWWVGPSCRPADLGRRLEAEGLQWASDTPGMAANLSALPPEMLLPAETQIFEVEDAKTLTLWAEACRRGFEIPEEARIALYATAEKVGLGLESPMRNFVTLQSGQPVAGASLCLAAGVAGIYTVSTAPEARRQGHASALVLRALHIARRLGYHIGILQSSSMGRRLYERIGFQEVCVFHLYRWDGEPKQETRAAGAADTASLEVI